jgi:hypothetical protein
METDRRIANELRSPMPAWKKNEQEHALGCVERLVQKGFDGGGDLFWR